MTTDDFPGYKPLGPLRWADRIRVRLWQRAPKWLRVLPIIKQGPEALERQAIDKAARLRNDGNVD